MILEPSPQIVSTPKVSSLKCSEMSVAVYQYIPQIYYGKESLYF